MKYKPLLIMIFIMSVAVIPSISATDLNVTDDDGLSLDNDCLNPIGDTITMDSGKSNLTSSSNVIYFDDSANSDGDGSKSNPFKYVNSKRLNDYINSGNDLTVYFAQGTYDLSDNMLVKSNVIFIGEDRENTIFNSKITSNFEIRDSFKLELNNITCRNVNIVNHGTFRANGVSFDGTHSDFQSTSGGIISSVSIGVSAPFVYLNDCIFNNSLAFNGGSIYLSNSNLIVKNSNFSNSRAKRLGGVIYAIDSYLSIHESNFNSNNASYGGIMYFDGSTLDLKDTNVYDSHSYSFGGAIASKHSKLKVDNCLFMDYSSLTDAGGAFYNFVGTVDIIKSSFINGHSQFGGAICNLASNLTVGSSIFLNNSAESYGGAINNMYGSLNIHDSFFNCSNAYRGGAVCSELSDDLTFTNNVFLNSTARQAGIIATDCLRESIVDVGNHYENIYHVYIEYHGYFDEKNVTLKSNVLDYVVSNTGNYLNGYGDNALDGDYHDFIKINIKDVYYPDNSTIFLTTDNSFNCSCRYIIDSLVYLTDNMCYFNMYLENDNGVIISQLSSEVYSLYAPGNFTLVHDFGVDILGNRYDAGSDKYPAMLFNSSTSQLTDIPSRYDGREYGYITQVKDQADGGNCWAFSGIATLEACLKKITGIEYDFSEENAKNLMASFSILGLDIDTNNGGFDPMIMSYLASWWGPIEEKTDSYDDLSSLSAVYSPNIYVQNIKFLPVRTTSSVDEIYKKAIMDYGAVSVSFKWLDAGNHAVSLVGWDDNYNDYDSLGTYTKGAWIFKNSWGTDWGDDGFGYLAYSTSFRSDTYFKSFAYTFEFSKDDIYRYNYQHDYAGVTDFLVFDGNVFYKNTFKMGHGIEFLEAFSTYFKVPTNYTVSVYAGNQLIHTQSGYSDAGYYTIPFNKAHVIDENTHKVFTIMIECHNSGKNYVPVSQAEKITIANFDDNCSFISLDGKNWIDLFDLRGYYEYASGTVKARTCQVACIKAFTSLKYFRWDVECDVDVFESVDVNQEVSINMNFTDSKKYFFDTLYRIDDTLVDVYINGKEYYVPIKDGKACLNISFDNPGRYTLQVQYSNNLFQSEMLEFNFTVNKKSTHLTANSISKIYGDAKQPIVTLKDSNGNAISNALVKVNLNGKTTIIKTNSKGQAYIGANIEPKSYVAVITYSGDKINAPSTARVNIVVKKATLKIIAGKKTFKRNVKTKKYTISLKDNFGKAIKNVKLTIKVKGKTYKATTNAKGKATFKITKLTKKGKIKSAIKFAGNAYYNSASKKVTIIVK